MNGISRRSFLVSLIGAGLGLVVAVALLPGCSTVQAETPASNDGSGTLTVSAATETAPTLSDKEISGIKEILVTVFAEDELSQVEVGLPVGVYALRMDEPGEYRFNTSEIYPVYKDDGIDGVVMGLGEEGLYKRPGQDSIYDELMALLDEGDCGSIAVITAADGTYLYDGTSIERLNDTGDALYFGMGEQVDTGFTELDGVDLPDDVLAQIELTDTGVKTPLG